MHDERLKRRAAVNGLNASPRPGRGPALAAAARRGTANGPFQSPRRSAGPPPRPKPVNFGFIGALWVAASLGLSCRSLPPLPPADLSAPGWRVQPGQAVWKPAKNRPELAGELLLASNTNGNFFVQFTKTPFALATAQRVGDRWQIELGAGDYRRSGRGRPPARFAWFQLPAALAGTAVSGDWNFDLVATNSWRLENHRTGEALEVSFFP
jgi:hypothetical protein